MSKIDQDLEAVEAALRAARKYVCANRNTGLDDLWPKLDQGLAALQHLKETVRVRQLPLFEQGMAFGRLPGKE